MSIHCVLRTLANLTQGTTSILLPTGSAVFSPKLWMVFASNVPRARQPDSTSPVVKPVNPTPAPLRLQPVDTFSTPMPPLIASTALTNTPMATLHPLTSRLAKRGEISESSASLSCRTGLWCTSSSTPCVSRAGALASDHCLVHWVTWSEPLRSLSRARRRSRAFLCVNFFSGHNRCGFINVHWILAWCFACFI